MTLTLSTLESYNEILQENLLCPMNKLLVTRVSVSALLDLTVDLESKECVVKSIYFMKSDASCFCVLL